MHGNPDWSFHYRKTIPILTANGFRAIATVTPVRGVEELTLGASSQRKRTLEFALRRP